MLLKNLYISEIYSTFDHLPQRGPFESTVASCGICAAKSKSNYETNHFGTALCRMYDNYGSNAVQAVADEQMICTQKKEQARDEPALIIWSIVSTIRVRVKL